jgi:hypothetical protein
MAAIGFDGIFAMLHFDRLDRVQDALSSAKKYRRQLATNRRGQTGAARLMSCTFSYADAGRRRLSRPLGKEVVANRVDSAQAPPQCAHKFVSYMIDGRSPRGD